MKKIVKKWWIWIVIVGLLIFVIGLTITINKIKSQGVGTAGISKEEFDKIKIGSTTMWEISKIIAPNKEWNDNDIYNKVVTEIEDSQKNYIYTHVYKYLGENGGYALVTFEADYSNGYFYNDFIVTKKENFDIK